MNNHDASCWHAPVSTVSYGVIYLARIFFNLLTYLRMRNVVGFKTAHFSNKRLWLHEDEHNLSTQPLGLTRFTSALTFNWGLERRALFVICNSLLLFSDIRTHQRRIRGESWEGVQTEDKRVPDNFVNIIIIIIRARRVTSCGGLIILHVNIQ